MSDARDPAIKLFGKTIQLPTCGEARGGVVLDEEKDVLESAAASLCTNQESAIPAMDELLTASSKSDQETAVSKDEEESNSEAHEEKTLKKPDKILPCPRCNSVETKFCYYNNYNVNQPRHFCKNCQRYWTAGGMMRNVPVGAGRRKNKSTMCHYRDLCASNVPQSLIHHPPPKPNGTLLNFSSDIAIHDSMASVLSLAEQNANSSSFHRGGEKMVPFACGVENDDDQSSVSSINQGTQEPTMQNSNRVPAPIPCFRASPCPYPWSPGQAFCASVPFYPVTAYWGCAVPSNWNMNMNMNMNINMPWLSALPSPNGDSSPNSPSLAKHPREGDVLKYRDDAERGDQSEHNGQEKRLWAPKTQRIDNPDVAAMSSIWSTIGIKHDEAGSGRGLFKAFQPKAETAKDHSTKAMHANPAAHSRSLSFQESS